LFKDLAEINIKKKDKTVVTIAKPWFTVVKPNDFRKFRE
jgi:hypothetical protein